MVNSGTLVLNGSALGNPAKILPQNSNLTINAGGTVSLQGTQSNLIYDNTSGTITINAGGLLSADNSGLNAQSVYAVVLSGGTLGAREATPGANDAIFYVYQGGGHLRYGKRRFGDLGLGKPRAYPAGTALGVDVAGGSSLLISGTVTNVPGAGDGLTKTDAGLLVLSGTNTYSGATTVSGGTLQIGNGPRDGSIAASSGIVNNAALVYNVLVAKSYAGTIRAAAA